MGALMGAAGGLTSGGGGGGYSMSNQSAVSTPVTTTAGGGNGALNLNLGSAGIQNGTPSWVLYVVVGVVLFAAYKLTIGKK
jgi:hypothetical protein